MIYDNFDAMWWGVLSRALHTGHEIECRGMRSKELRGYQATLTDIHRNFLMNPRRKLSPIYASAELLWYLSGDDSVTMIRAYAPQYESFAENDGTVHGAYGRRWEYDDGRNQLLLAIEALKRYRETRQCVVSMWRADDLLCIGAKRDLPCTMTWQFMIRDDRLHMICTMRSNDIWLGMPYDVYANTTIQKLMAIALNVGVGDYTHQVGSIHLYDKNVAASREVVKFETPLLRVPTCTSGFNFAEQVEWATRAEECVRMNLSYTVDGLDHILADAVRLCSSKWCDIPIDWITTPLLRRAYNAHRRGNR